MKTKSKKLSKKVAAEFSPVTSSDKISKHFSTMGKKSWQVRKKKLEEGN